MSLSDETLDELDQQAGAAVRAGYDPDEAIREGLLELIEFDPATEAEVAADREAAVQAVGGVVERHAAAHAEAERDFPDPTDPERITALFAELEADGVAARENVGFTQQDLVEEMRELLEGDPALRGWVAFHQQDVDRAVEDGLLHLAFAHRTARDEDVGIGEEVAERARGAGFDVDWDGSPEHRIALRGIRWQRRRAR